MTSAGELATRLAYLEQHCTAPLPTVELTAAWGEEDRAMVPRIYSIVPGVPGHTVFAVLTALRVIQHLDAQPHPGGSCPGFKASGLCTLCGDGRNWHPRRPGRYRADTITDTALHQLYDDLDWAREQLLAAHSDIEEGRP
ncbi:hypothetical protein [Streptomyces goshikiensis]